MIATILAVIIPIVIVIYTINTLVDLTEFLPDRRRDIILGAAYVIISATFVGMNLADFLTKITH